MASLIERRKLMQLVAEGGSILPREYQQVEWIRSDGSAWLSDLFAIDNTSVIHLKLIFVSTTYSANSGYTNIIGGNRYAYSSKAVISPSGWNQENGYFWWCWGSGSGVSFTANTAPKTYDRIVDLKMSTDGMLVDGVSYGSALLNLDAPELISLFPDNSYSHKRPTTDVLIALVEKGDNQNNIYNSFVPCYRKADNVAGMYDTINDVFVTNAGSGAFVVGGDV